MAKTAPSNKCAVCDEFFVVQSLARICEDKHAAEDAKWVAEFTPEVPPLRIAS